MSGVTTAERNDGRSGGVVRNDLLASIVVFLVALPLCMGIAVASGAPPAAGLLTGVIGGIVVGLIAGCPLQVSGPAAGLTVIVVEIVTSHGLAVLGVVVLLAGLLQIAAGLCRLGQIFRAVSPAVIHGMLAGIGVLIFASQFHVMVDDPKRASGLENLRTIPEAVLKGVIPGSAHHVAAAIGLLTIVLIVIWPMVAPKKLKLIPAALVGVGGAALCSWILGLSINYVTIPDRLWDEVNLPTSASLQALFSKEIIIAALTVALVASAETLLCASAVDQMQTGPRTRYDRELFAQGVGNSICGLIGALPMTGVIVRSSANINAGGRTRMSAILHGFWLLLFIVALPDVIRLIPMSALGAMLVYTGYKLAHPQPVRELLRFGKGEVAIYAITVATIVGFDLLTGVIAGIVASAIKLLYRFSHLRVRFETVPDGSRTLLHLDGAATFIRLPRLAAALDQVPANTELHVRTDHLTYIDHACLDLLNNWRNRHEAVGGALVLDWDKLNARGPLLSAAARPAAKRKAPAALPASTGVHAGTDGRPQDAAVAVRRGVDGHGAPAGAHDQRIRDAAERLSGLGEVDVPLLPQWGSLPTSGGAIGVFARPLIGLSLTESDAGLLQYMAQVADLQHCEQLRFTHVVRAGHVPPNAADVEALRTRMRDEVLLHFGSTELSFEFDVVHGSREDELLALATAHHCDVIILGHSRRANGQRALAKRIATFSNCSVWLVPIGAAAQLTSVLVPVDFSEHSAEALSFAAMIVSEQGLKRCLALHVYPESPTTHFGEQITVQADRVRETFAQFLNRVNLHGVEVDMLIEEGNRPAETILRTAEQHDVDLIVMNTQGRSRAAAVLLGSITAKTMEATDIPLLAFKHLGSRRTLLQALFHPRPVSAPSMVTA